MPLLKWDQSFSVEVEELDKQHRKLFSIINKLYDSFEGKKAQTLLNGILNDLKKYGELHFLTEERYFDKFNYPESLEHKKEHNNYRKQILEFNLDTTKDKTDVITKLMVFLNEWWADHVMRTDKRYIMFFHKHGLR
jgi:hemerythrin